MNLYFKQLKHNKLAFVSFIILAVLYVSMILCEFIAPYDPNQVFEQHIFAPASFTMYSPELGFGPQVQKTALVDKNSFKYARIKGEYASMDFFVKGKPYRLFGIIPMDIHLFGSKTAYEIDGKALKGTAENYPVLLLGADNMGRDIFSRILYGSRVSLTIGFIGSFISFVLAILLGGIAGFYGGFWDWGIMRVAEFIILIPGLYLILFLRSVLSDNLESGQMFLLITMILSFVGWPGKARLIRGKVHSIKREDFIEAAKLQGIPSVVIIFKQIIPQMASILIISVTLSVPGFIIGETVLSYLGLGIIEPAVSWGSMLSRAITSLSNIQRFPWLLFPGLFILIVTLAFNALGENLRDFFDPYHRIKKQKKAQVGGQSATGPQDAVGDQNAGSSHAPVETGEQKEASDEQ